LICGLEKFSIELEEDEPKLHHIRILIIIEEEEIL